MAPDVLRCQPYSLKSDVFSVGAIIYEMANEGEPLFSSSCSAKMIKKNMICDVWAKLEGLRCSPSLVSLLKLMLSPDLQQRPTASECL